MHKITPCLWFDGNAEEAMNFYAGIFEGFRLLETMRHSKAGPGKEGSVLAVTFELAGQPFMGLNGGPQFHFTPAISMFVKCASQEEVDRYWSALAAGGREIQCGWVTDKFGISWQIVPTVLGEMLRDPDKEKAARVMKAMMGMIKLDVAGLQRAYDGA